MPAGSTRRLELEKKLAPHATTPDELSAVLDELERNGWLSSNRVMEQVIHMRKSRFGSRRIAHELREKGIAENLIAAALPNLLEAEQVTAREVWRKKFGVIPGNAKEFMRQMRFLSGPGLQQRCDHPGSHLPHKFFRIAGYDANFFRHASHA